MDKRFLAECLDRGLLIHAMGLATGRHPSTVSYWLKKHGLVAVGRDRHAAKGLIDRDRLQSLVDEGLTIEKIAQRVGVCDTTVRGWLRRHGLRTHHGQRRDLLAKGRKSGRPDVLAQCAKHGEVRHAVLATERRLRCMKCRAEAVTRRRRNLKETLVKEAGGQCVICGYSRHQAALQFHHLDPTSKSFGLGIRGITRSLDKLREEAKKCVLLCANCHALVEVGAEMVPEPRARVVRR